MRVTKALFRGALLEELEDAIRTAAWTSAEAGRFDCRKDFPFEEEWRGTWYARKQVRPIFVEEETEIVVITVYTYYTQG